jgi:Rrf2 family transcriptional regulator, iron-sulfur cluster assembly transcription factor
VVVHPFHLPHKEISMRLTTQGRFAVAAMLDIALRARTGPVALATISTRQNVSVSYLEQMFSKLRRHGLVESTRGPGGGYTLGRKPDDISVADIIAAIEVPTGRETADDALAGDAQDLALTRDLWAALNDRMTAHMRGISLKKLVDEQVAKGTPIDDRPARTRPAIMARPKTPPVRADVPNSVFALGTLAASR